MIILFILYRILIKKKKNMKKIKEEFNFLNLDLKKEFLLKIIYNETMLFIKNKNKINKIEENLEMIFFLFHNYSTDLIKFIINYENKLFFLVKQFLFFIILMKYLFFVITKKIIISIFTCKYSFFIINFKNNINLKYKKTEIIDTLSKDKFMYTKYVSEKVIQYILNILVFLIDYFI
ncbi:MAG: hypothetical protein ACM3Q5_00165 [Candidatus Carsonella ruddii]